jgi:hypothetical protein
MGKIKAEKSPPKENQRSYKGIIFNVLFSGYAILAGILFSRSFSISLEEKSTFPVLGVLVFMVSLAEALALRLKLRSALSLDTRGKITPNRVMIFFGPLFFRTLLGLALAAGMAYLMVPSIRERTTLNFIVLGMAALLVLKELFVLFSSISLLLRPKPKKLPSSKRLLCDFILLTYACITYTVLTFPGFMFSIGTSRDLSGLAIIAMMFTFGFLSVRVAYFLEEYLTLSNWKQGLALAISVLLAVYFGVRGIAL